MHRRVRHAAIASGCALPLALVAWGCRAPTQVTLEITTDVPGCGLREVAIVVGADPRAVAENARLRSWTTTAGAEACAGGRVGDLVITPGVESGRGAVLVVGGVDRPATQCSEADGFFGCIVARRSFAFVDHASLRLPIALTLDCKNVPCDAVSTCKTGACVASEAACSGEDCGAFGVGEDGGASFVDAPTSSDAVAPPAVPAPTLPDAGPDDAALPDASPDAALPGDGQLRCAPYTGEVCDGHCCALNTGSSGYQCTPDGAGCPSINGPSMDIRCTGATQCAGGQRCCGFYYVSTTCASDCTGTDGGAPPSYYYWVCETDADCPPPQRCTGRGTASLRTCQSP